MTEITEASRRAQRVGFWVLRLGFWVAEFDGCIRVIRGYLGCFFAKLTLEKMLMAAMPAKKMTEARRPPPETCPARNRMAPTTKLKSAQTTFTIGEDKPFPGGLANGVGNGSPDTPFTK